LTEPESRSFPGEAVFAGRLPIKYVLQQPPGAPHDLLVVFAGMNPIPPEPARYSYVRTLKDVIRNKLFILDDYGPRGCYYLGKNRVLDFEEAVIDLIRHVASEVGLLLAEITACGSSKGGFASLYYSAKYGFRRAIAGGPQTLLGDYLVSPFGTFDNILDWVVGEHSEAAREWLNSLLFDVIRTTAHRPQVDLHVGRGDRHLRQHVRPFVRMLEERGGFKWTLALGEYSEHGLLGEFFPPFLLAQLEDPVSSAS
jgi:hypothetical protein